MAGDALALPIDRVPCCIPGCRRGIGGTAWVKRFGHAPSKGSEYICQPHWQMAPSNMKRVLARIKRRERRFDCQLDASVRIWRRIKREVIEMRTG